MNWAHAHLLLNHIPIFGSVFGLAILIVAMARKNRDLQKVSFWVFLTISAITIPTYLTGEPAEEVVEHLPGVPESAIEEHEESAAGSLVALEVLGVFSLAGLFFFRRRHPIPRWFVVTCLILSFATVAMVAWTSHLGSHIRHPETRAGFQSPAD